MLTIKCAKCHRKIFKYKKIGKGKLIRCYNKRIVQDYSVREGNQVKCECGNLIGIAEGNLIRMKQQAFLYVGTITKK